MFTNSPIHTIKFYLSSFQYFSTVIAIHIRTYIFSIFQCQPSHSMYEANSTSLCVNIQRVQVLQNNHGMASVSIPPSTNYFSNSSCHETSPRVLDHHVASSVFYQGAKKYWRVFPRLLLSLNLLQEASSN